MNVIKEMDIQLKNILPANIAKSTLDILCASTYYVHFVHSYIFKPFINAQKSAI